MTQAEAARYFNSVFTQSELAFLSSDAEFQQALLQATEKKLPELNELGVRLLLEGGYHPPQARSVSFLRFQTEPLPFG